MDTQSCDLEEECENAVFEICCTRERYSVRCANQLEKQLALTRKNITAPVQTSSLPSFQVPTITEEQQELFQKLPSKSSRQANSDKDSHKQNVLGSLRELESILNLIDRSKGSEFQKLLKNEV